MDSKKLVALASLSAAICAITGIAYTIRPLVPGPPAALVLAPALIGAAALVTAGLWAHWAPAVARGLPFAILGTLAAGYTFANVIGLLLKWTTTALNWVGLICGGALFLAVLVQILSEQRHARNA